MLSPISLGSSFVLSNTAVTTSAPSVSASTSFRAPPYRPTGVRTGLQMTASLILFLLIAMRPLGRISSEHGSARRGHRPDLLLRVAGRRHGRRADLAQKEGGRGRAGRDPNQEVVGATTRSPPSVGLPSSVRKPVTASSGSARRSAGE